MKALHIMDHMDLGGAQFLVKGIFEKYQNPEHYLFTMRSSDIKIHVNHPNYSISKSDKAYSFYSLIEIKQLISKHNITILHCYLLKSQIFGWILKKFYFPKIKLVFHEVGEILMNDRAIYTRFMKISSKKVDVYMAASQAVKRQLIRKANIKSEKIELLYNYIIFEDFNRKNFNFNVEKIKQKFNIPNDTTIIGYAGRLSIEKGCEYLIKSIPYIKSKIKIIIAGNGNERSNLELLTKELKVSDKVKFLGFVDNIQEFYSVIDIQAIPSIHESFGLIAVEAQAMGIPVIASNIQGLNEVVVDNKSGLLFEVKNTKILAEKIDFLIKNSSLKDDIIQGAYENIKKFGIHDYYTHILKIYETLLK